jgi:hypothetical protein
MAKNKAYFRDGTGAMFEQGGGSWNLWRLSAPGYNLADSATQAEHPKSQDPRFPESRYLAVGQICYRPSLNKRRKL